MAVTVPPCQPSDAAPGTERLGPLHLWALTCLNLAYGFMLADQGMLLAPLESERLFSERASLGLAAMAVCCGLAQLVGPVAGHWSDQHRSRFGRRRPCLVMAFTAVCALTFALRMCSELRMSYVFLMVFLMQQFAWNVLLTVQSGLVPDLVPAHQRGAAGGATAANTLAGALSALLMAHFAAGLGLGMHYASMVALGAVCVVLVCAFADERSSLQCAQLPTASAEGAGGTLARWRSYYELDVRRHPEFAKLLFSKALYCSSVMVKGFLLFFIQDTFKLADAAAEQALVSETAIAAESTAALSALAAMLLLDATVGQMCNAEDPKKRMELGLGAGAKGGAQSQGESDSPEEAASPGFIRARQAGMLGAAWMGLLWFGPLLVGLGVLRDASGLLPGDPLATSTARAWMPYMVAGTGIWGVGQGVYLAGDQALSYALLPDPEQASRFLGLTSVCACIGAMFGGSATGFLLYTLGGGGSAAPANHAGHAAPGYTYEGYAAMFILASLLSVGASATISTINPAPDAERARMVTA